MFSPDQYQLIDFGDGRRLEQFGALVIDRPCPAAEGFQRADPNAWEKADARFEHLEGDEGEREGTWTAEAGIPDRWNVVHGVVTFELKRSPVGHLGVFPEQAANWDWIAGQVQKHAALSQEPLNVLNLFAYTGGSTLAAAAAGASVVHVDAAKNTVGRARRNAELSGLADRSVRWIADDAMKFCKREVKRGSMYDAVILDPPSYGHGARGEVWRLSKHLPRLLELCAQLTAGRRRFMLLTSHTPGYDPAKLRQMMLDALKHEGFASGREMTIRSAAGRELPGGVVVRWGPDPPPPCVDPLFCET